MNTGTNTRTRNRLARWTTRYRLRLVATVEAPAAWKPRRGRRAAQAIATGVIVALALQLATGWVIQTNRVPLRDPIYADKLATLRAHPGFAPSNEQTQKLLFLGSSRTLNGIDAGAVEAELTNRLGRPAAAFNFGCPGAGPITNAVYLRRLLADGVKPHAVVIEVHPLLLAAQTDSPPEMNWFPSIRLRPEELALVRGFGFAVPTPPAHGCRGWLLPLYEYRLALIDRYATPMSSLSIPMTVRHISDQHGFARLLVHNPEMRPRLLNQAHRQYVAMLANYQPGGCGVAALRDLLGTCRAAGIRTALLLTPESSEFRSWYPEPGQARIRPLLNELACEFGSTLIDTREWLPDELFNDGHHLTGPGADAFTNRLTRDAVTPWLSSRERGGTP